MDKDNEVLPWLADEPIAEVSHGQRADAIYRNAVDRLREADLITWGLNVLAAEAKTTVDADGKETTTEAPTTAEKLKVWSKLLDKIYPNVHAHAIKGEIGAGALVSDSATIQDVSALLAVIRGEAPPGVSADTEDAGEDGSVLPAGVRAGPVRH